MNFKYSENYPSNYQSFYRIKVPYYYINNNYMDQNEKIDISLLKKMTGGDSVQARSLDDGPTTTSKLPPQIKPFSGAAGVWIILDAEDQMESEKIREVIRMYLAKDPIIPSQLLERITIFYVKNDDPAIYQDLIGTRYFTDDRLTSEVGIKWFSQYADQFGPQIKGIIDQKAQIRTILQKIDFWITKYFTLTRKTTR